MAFEHSRSGAGRADLNSRGRNAAVIEDTKDLAGFSLDFFLFTGDEGDDVVEDVERDNTRRTTGPGHPLHRGHDDFLEAEVIKERFERNRQTNRSAVRLSGNKSLPATVLFLSIKQVDVVQVHAWNEDRYILLVAKCRRGADDRRGPSVERFEFPGHV